MLGFATNKLLMSFYERLPNLLDEDLESYVCEPLIYQGHHQVANFSNTQVNTAHNVKVPAIAIHAEFRETRNGTEWIACDPDIKFDSTHRDLMAGPRYHRYWKRNHTGEQKGAETLREQHFTITVGE
ncbi:hypothetical protein JCM5353_002260 [Sporobolomyces roseus]